jgi:hypothetical protein
MQGPLKEPYWSRSDLFYRRVPSANSCACLRSKQYPFWYALPKHQIEALELSDDQPDDGKRNSEFQERARHAIAYEPSSCTITQVTGSRTSPR